jgi:hypothetical protein
MSDPDQTDTLAADAPEAPVPPPAQPAYVATPRPRFGDQGLGMWAVIAVALAMLIIGGLSGFLLGERTNGGDRFGHGPVGFQGGQHVFPRGPTHGFMPGGPQGSPGQQSPFGQQGPANPGQRQR